MKEHDIYQMDSAEEASVADIYGLNETPATPELEGDEKLKATLELASTEQIVDALEESDLSSEQIQNITDSIRNKLEAQFFASRAAEHDARREPLSLSEQQVFLKVLRDQIKERIAEEKSSSAPDEGQLRLLGYQVQGTFRLRDALEGLDEGATKDEIQAVLERNRESLSEEYPKVVGGNYGFEDNYLGYHTTGAQFMEAGIILSAIYDKPDEARQLIDQSVNE